ncbi:TPA: permease [Escherichia coli]
MKHVVNILLLGVVLLGIVMMTDTPWGIGVALAPFAVWVGRFLVLVHRSIWASIVFWAGVAYFSWQASLVVLVSFILVQTFKADKSERVGKVRCRKRRNTKHNDDEMHLSIDSSVRSGLGLGSGIGISDE